jgi:hypothetical protein
MPCWKVFEQINQGRRHHGWIAKGTFVFAMKQKGIREEMVNITYFILLKSLYPSTAASNDRIIFAERSEISRNRSE